MRLLLSCLLGSAQIPLGLYLYFLFSAAPVPKDAHSARFDADIIPAAERFDQYEHFLRGKRLGLVVNHTSLVGNTHLVDTLLKRGHQVVCIFAPEHGFRGDADAGEKLANQVDPRTKLPIISLYGKVTKPDSAQMAAVDLVLFDIQDVGVRFYTYTSTMSYMMEACAERQKPMLILDRPNPNGHYVDGPILRPELRSFVGLHPVPVVHGLTPAEYARMINEEGWLANGARCVLHYVECANYDHQRFYKLPVPPSPNLRDMRSIYLYPALCFFEGTVISVGRGTEHPFQRYGHPSYPKTSFSFTPSPMFGSKKPLHLGEVCYGRDLSKLSLDELQAAKQLDLSYLFDCYQKFPDTAAFFVKTNFFELLAGTPQLRAQLKAGVSLDSVRRSWQPDLERYKALRRKYLLYRE